MVQQGWDGRPHLPGASPSFFKRYWGAFQERRERERLRAVLYGLSDWELKGYRHCARPDRLRRLEPRYRPARHPIRRMNVRYLATVDGGIGHDQTHRRGRLG